MTEIRSEQAARLFRDGLTTAEIGAAMGVTRRRVDYHLACYRIAHPGELPYRVTGRKPRAPLPKAWSPERVAFLKSADVARLTIADLLPEINAITPGPSRPLTKKALTAKYDRMRAAMGIENANGQTWEDACGAAGLLFDDAPEEPIPAGRRGIMTGKPPNHDELVARKVVQAAQSRHAVAEVYARGLVG